jgi:Rieske 2Fe-2S family protein
VSEPSSGLVADIPELHLGPSREQFISVEWHERDLDVVFRPRWQFVGHADEIDEPGSFMTYALAGDEVVICRRADGGLNAFHNFCRHRGHRLVTDSHGKLRRNLTCPYHGWTYSKEDGACLAATRMPEGFDRRGWSLYPAWVEEFHKLVFVCVAEEKPVSIKQATAGLLTPEGGFGGYDLDAMKLAASTEFVVEANWKVVKENDDECYHCALNHPELIKGYDPWNGPTVSSGSGLEDQWTTREWELLELGLQQSASRVCAIPSARTDGDGDVDAQDVQFFWFASGHVILTRDHTWIWSIVPLGPEQTLVRQWWLVAPEAQLTRDYERDSLMHLFNTTMRQDQRLCEEVQRGLRMHRYTPGPLNLGHQSPAAAFYRWYEENVTALGPVR